MDKRVLFVEDDPSIREITSLGLREAGLSVETAADGREALVRFRAEPYDLVVLDVMLPKLGGLEVWGWHSTSRSGRCIRPPHDDGNANRAELVVRGVPVAAAFPVGPESLCASTIAEAELNSVE